MEWSDTALVLHVGRFRESDIWLRLLTRRHGLVSAFAFGGSRSRKRFCGCLDLFNELQIRTKTTGNGQYLALQEGSLLNGPRRLRTDRSRLGMFMNCVRFTETLGIPPDSSTVIFPLLKDLLCLLEGENGVQHILPVLFRLRLASDLGYAPAFSGCSGCGRQFPEAARFLISEGTVLCPACTTGPAGGNGVDMSPAALEALRGVQTASPLDWNFLDEAGDAPLRPAEQRECARAVDGFVQYHLGITWENGRFRRL